MAVLFGINVIIILVLFVMGGIVVFFNFTQFPEIIQKKSVFENLKLFLLLFTLGGTVMLIIFILNINAGLIEINGHNDLSLLLKAVPKDFSSSFGQEFLMRVLVFIGILNLGVNKTYTLLITSLMFCLLHMPIGIIGVTTYFLAGLMYGLAFLKFQSIWAPIGLHCAWNYFQGAVFNFPDNHYPSHGIFDIKIIESEFWNSASSSIEYSYIAILGRIVIIISILLISKYIIVSKSPDFLNFNAIPDDV